MSIPWTMRPDAVSAAAKYGMRKAELEAELEAKLQSELQIAEPFEDGFNIWVARLLFGWTRLGRQSYRVAPDLFEALCLTDVADDVFEKVKVAHPGAWYEFPSVLTTEGAECPGFFAAALDTGIVTAFVVRGEARPWIALSQVEMRSTGWTTPILAARALLLYMMDPAHEETPERLHGNREWRQAMKTRGARDPDDSLGRVNHRVVGKSYRLPDEARDGDPSGLRIALRHPVRGHIRMQPCGVGRKEVRATWVQPHWRGPKDGLVVPVVTDLTMPTSPSHTPEDRVARILEASRRRS